MRRYGLAFLVMGLILCPALCVFAQDEIAAEVEAEAAGGGIGAFVSNWGPTAVGLLLGLGVLGWLREKAKESKLVQKLGVQSMIDAVFDRAVLWAENYAKSSKLSGVAKVREAIKKGTEALEAEGVVITESAASVAVEAAHRRAESAGLFLGAATSNGASD